MAANVLYASIQGVLSSDVGERYACRLQGLITPVEAFHYLVDASELTSYDLIGRSAITRIIFANRKKFSSIVVLSWAGGIGPVARSFATAIGNVEYVTRREEFESRLKAVTALAAQPAGLQGRDGRR